MNVEALLKRIPELAPSPELEARIAAASKPRGRWIVPLAAAVLFCAGVSWFALGGKGKPDRTFRVVFAPEGVFADGRALADLSELVVPADRAVVVIGPDTVPWGQVREIRRACDKAGHQDFEWRVGGKELKVNPRVPKPPLEAMAIRLEDIRVVLRPGLRRVGERAPVTSDKDLMKTIRHMVIDYGKAGKTRFPIVIDGVADVPWREIVAVIELCRNAGFHDIQLEPTPILPPPPVRVPDERQFPGRPKDD